jgi:hypothetical protein
MENIAILLGLIIKYGILLIFIVGCFRLLILRKDTRRHYITITFTIVFGSMTIYIFGGNYFYKRQKAKEISGDYKLEYYKCNKCPNCIVRLNKNGTYQLIKEGNEIDKGHWDFSIDLMGVFLEIENGSNSDLLDSTKTLSYIKNDNCQEIWRKENLKTAINGKVVQIDTIHDGYGVYAIFIEDVLSKVKIRYEPKYIGHPWLNDKVEIGDRIIKQSNSMTFQIEKANKTIVKLEEK